MITAEKIREWIVDGIWNNPKLGVNYINWYTENGDCGLTIYPCGEEFEIIIKKKNDNRKCANCGRLDGWNGCGEYVNNCMQDYNAYSNWIPKEEQK